MPFTDGYQAQVRLLLRVLPMVAEETDFALKGGTAINLFIRDLPRLSVDIDLTYLPIASRPDSLKAIDAAMNRLAEKIEKGLPGAQLTKARLVKEGVVCRLIVRVDGVQVKIEVTPVLRGCVYDAETRAVSAVVENTFGFAEAQIASFPDLYAGKIVAALDRQHPRDLFDGRSLLANEGINEELRKAFIVYLLSHDRPMCEVLAPNLKEITADFLEEFEGMTAEPVTLAELYAARDALILNVVGQMPEAHRRFLISFEEGEPDWDLLGVPRAANLPAVRWRQQNLDILPKEKRADLVHRLVAVLSA